jgi:hypothetical protein
VGRGLSNLQWKALEIAREVYDKEKAIPGKMNRDLCITSRQLTEAYYGEYSAENQAAASKALARLDKRGLLECYRSLRAESGWRAYYLLSEEGLELLDKRPTRAHAFSHYEYQ